MNYLITANIYLSLFYGFYRFCLAKETFFQINRFYLIATTFLAFILPLIHLESLQGIFNASTMVAARSGLDAVTVYAQPVSLRPIDDGFILPIWFWVYLTGSFIQISVFIWRLTHLNRLLKTSVPGDAYSFFHIMRVDKRIEGGDWVARHEQVHIKQKHSLDVLFFETVKLFNWFNPVVYALGKSVKLLHEYIADEAVNTSQEDKITYAELLISRTFSIPSQVLTNQFLNHSTIKRRIEMLFKNKSKNRNLLKFIWVVPLFFAMLIFSSARIEDTEQVKQTSKAKVAMYATTSWDALRDTTKQGIADFKQVEEQPLFPGGIKAFYEWIGRSYKYPQEAKDKGVSGTLVLGYIVEKDGRLTDIKVIRDLGYQTGEAAVALLKQSPKWSPGKIKGEPVRVSYTLPIRLNLAADSTAKQ